MIEQITLDVEVAPVHVDMFAEEVARPKQRAAAMAASAAKEVARLLCKQNLNLPIPGANRSRAALIEQRVCSLSLV